MRANETAPADTVLSVEAQPEGPSLQVIATAGHVDHGKSALILRLTGIDPDRLGRGTPGAAGGTTLSDELVITLGALLAEAYSLRIVERRLSVPPML